MKTLLFNYIIILSLILSGQLVNAQICNITSPPPYGGIHPASDSLPCIIQNEPISISLQFFAYRRYTANPVRWIRIDSILNLPCGINWATNKQTDSLKNQFSPGELGCISLFGTTSDPAGNYKLKVYITAELGNGIYTFNTDPVAFGSWSIDPIYGTPTSALVAPTLRVIGNNDICPPFDTSAIQLTSTCRAIDTASQAYFGQVHGRVFYDNNSNGIEDSNDFPLQDHPLLANNQAFAFTNSNGAYSSLMPIGNYSIAPETLTNNYTVTTGSASVTQTITGGSNDTISFGLYPTTPTTNIRIEAANSNFRPGFTSNVWLSVINNGNTLIDTFTVSYTYHDSMRYFMAAPSPSTINGNVLNWSASDLRPGEKRMIHVRFGTPINISLLDSTFTTYAAVSTIIGETDTTDNYAELDVNITGSYDPNDKTAYPSEDLDKHFIDSGKPIKYRIRFQNTGTDTAFNVIVRDVIDNTKFDVSSIKLLGASHNYQFQLQDRKHASWEFNNILLPDSNVNEPASHGYIMFEINMLPSIGDGDEVSNSAGIYFDYNPVVLTDTAISKVRYTVGVPELVSMLEPKIYPNPANNILYVELIGSTMIRVDIVDLSGKTVLQANSTGDKLSTNISSLYTGIYIVHLTDGLGNTANRKLLINR